MEREDPVSKVKKVAKKRPSRIKCPGCKGSGWKEYDGGVVVMPCIECKGQGRITRGESKNAKRNGDSPD